VIPAGSRTTTVRFRKPRPLFSAHQTHLDTPADVTVTATSAPAILHLSTYVGLTASGSYLLRWQDPFFSIPAALELVHVSTGTVTPFLGITVLPVAAWR
jgi:hypothetical protein